jgi:hypothetical protein
MVGGVVVQLGRCGCSAGQVCGGGVPRVQVWWFNAGGVLISFIYIHRLHIEQSNNDIPHIERSLLSFQVPGKPKIRAHELTTFLKVRGCYFLWKK